MTAFWLIAFIALVAGEAVTVGLVCIWFAAGAVGGFLVAVLGGQFWFQLIVFAAVSALTGLGSDRIAVVRWQDAPAAGISGQN